ncbi:hypothetical protein [Asanoa siamensis]|uniref:Deazaflavin-dependent oxidoreductase (Nitroreductase family) n=1 Tax=Asanoa siamensis TaxID=926357 RepID=A0ABQ4D2G1_9ACTN|nr:hypothetical protein [Asanoa siamensis]GIF77727.1 hypothetical protein Asi02nite_72450 [Asanoa siamensis]
MSNAVRTVVNRINAFNMAWHSSPRFGRLVRPWLTVITYTGRRSGRTFSTPVAYARTAAGVRIDVAMPDAKTWWRNFTGEGAPISVRLDGEQQVGHALARRASRRRVVVEVSLRGQQKADRCLDASIAASSEVPTVT